MDARRTRSLNDRFITSTHAVDLSGQICGTGGAGSGQAGSARRIHVRESVAAGALFDARDVRCNTATRGHVHQPHCRCDKSTDLGCGIQDGAPVPEDAAVEDSVASASEVGEDYDDSDMYMEPDESETTSRVDRAEESTVREHSEDEAASTDVATESTENSSSTEKSIGTEKPDADANLTKDQEAKNTQHTAVVRLTDAEDKSLESESQNFFPSFAELFANHRVPFAEQQRYRSNRFLGYFQRDRANYQAAASANKDHSLLGSGNFGVIRGGTYYPEDKERDEYSVDESLYNPYYHSRGRSHYYRNPKPQPIRGGDFFANFRDFADITAPPKSSFSHLSVVYANKNGSSTGRITEPRNIIETLRMLEEEERSNAEETTTTEIPRKKQSKGKRKLMKMKQYEEDKARRSRMSVEPLLALS